MQWKKHTATERRTALVCFWYFSGIFLEWVAYSLGASKCQTYKTRKHLVLRESLYAVCRTYVLTVVNIKTFKWSTAAEAVTDWPHLLFFNALIFFLSYLYRRVPRIVFWQQFMPREASNNLEEARKKKNGLRLRVFRHQHAYNGNVYICITYRALLYVHTYCDSAVVYKITWNKNRPNKCKK